MSSIIQLETFLKLGGDPKQDAAMRWLRARAPRADTHVIEKIRPLGNTYTLTRYLKQLKLWPHAKGKMQEVHYRNEPGGARFFALGWKNEAGGWVIQNPRWHGVLGPKAITVIPGSDQRVAVFETYLEYLRWHVGFKSPDHTVIVLNSSDFLEAGVYLCRFFRQAELFYTNRRFWNRIRYRYEGSIDFSVTAPLYNEGYANLLHTYPHLLTV